MEFVRISGVEVRYKVFPEKRLDLIFDGNCRQIQIDDGKSIPQSTYTIKIEMTLLVVEGWIVIQFNSTGPSTVAGVRNMCIDVEARCWILDTVDEEHDVRNFKNVH